MTTPPYQVIVAGGGHAGCEAALASARLGAKTVLVTMEKKSIARMPCNPSVGGIAKSHLVFELDALGGEMARNTDCTGIQFRTLNTRKGPAVQSNRVQCDKAMYSSRMQAILEATENLDIIQGKITSILTGNGQLQGVCLDDGSEIHSETVVITAGTFLKGRIHIGKECVPGGGGGSPAADELSQSLKDLGCRVERLKTGTPPRIHKDSIQYDKMSIQLGSEPAPFFSRAAGRYRELFHVEQSPAMFHVEQLDERILPWIPGTDQIPCYLTHTTEETHQVIEDNLKKSSLYGGAISGTGVRYCPSIEDKIVKFREKDSHHVFIEPEGRNTNLIYPNGLSNSLPRDVQEKMVHSVPGLEKAEIIDWGYAIEYDFCDPTQLYHTLESKLLKGLFLAGQINGTTGYEEAAAQGFMAGINAAGAVLELGSFEISRTEGYIGVLIDDLVTKGTDEPYRMFTSRAERRLILRQDNARFRMLDLAERLNIVDEGYLAETRSFRDEVRQGIESLTKTRDAGSTLLELLRQPAVGYRDLPGVNIALHEEVIRQIEIQVQYEGYIKREQKQVDKALEMERVKIPVDIDYWKMDSLRYEAREKFSEIQPENLGQAGRISGISPADTAILAVLIKRNPNKKS